MIKYNTNRIRRQQQLIDTFEQKYAYVTGLEHCHVSLARHLVQRMQSRRLKGLLDRDSFASQLATQMQMERLHPKIEMLFAIRYCRVPCIYAQASQLCGAAAVCCQRSISNRDAILLLIEEWRRDIK